MKKILIIAISLATLGIYAKDDYVKIDQYCYKENGLVYNNDGNQLKIVEDPKTFKKVGVYSGENEYSLYYKDSKNVYCDRNSAYSAYGDPLMEFHIITGADNQTFKQKYKYEEFYTDKNNLYFTCEKIPGGDPATFSTNKYGEYFDKNQVYEIYTYYEAGIDYLSNITGADSQTFRKIKHNIVDLATIYKDKDHVFSEEHMGSNLVRLLENSDADTFRAKVFKYDGRIYYLFKDKNQVYINYGSDRGNTIEIAKGIDPSSFKFWAPNVISDKDNVFTMILDNESGNFEITKLQGADAGSFRSYLNLDHQKIYKDKNFVYYGTSTINMYYGITNNKIYKIPGIDAQSFTYLKGGYAKDKNYIYYLGNDEIYKIEGVDRNTFNVKGDGVAEDKNYGYKGVNKTKK